ECGSIARAARPRALGRRPRLPRRHAASRPEALFRLDRCRAGGPCGLARPTLTPDVEAVQGPRSRSAWPLPAFRAKNSSQNREIAAAELLNLLCRCRDEMASRQGVAMSSLKLNVSRIAAAAIAVAAFATGAS